MTQLIQTVDSQHSSHHRLHSTFSLTARRPPPPAPPANMNAEEANGGGDKRSASPRPSVAEDEEHLWIQEPVLQVVREQHELPDG